MGGIIPSRNYVTGDLRISGGSVVVDTGADEGLKDSAGNYAGSTTSDVPSNAAVGYFNNLDLWADGGLRFTVSDAGFIANGESDGFTTRKNLIHAWGYIVYSAGVPSHSGASSHNIASITDVGPGHARINMTTANPTTGYLIMATAAASALYAGVSVTSASAFEVRIYDAAGAPTDYHFYCMAGKA